MLRIHTTWRNSGIPILNYEEMLNHDIELLLPILMETCPLGVSQDVVVRAIEQNRFESVTGRARGVEDIESHFRRGQPGDWRRHFTPRVAEAFEAQFGSELKALGYVRDANWTAEVEGRGPSLRPAIHPRTTAHRNFSIVMMLPQHRGHAFRAVQRWTEGQRYPGDRFELIIVSDGTDRQLEMQLSSCLRSTDQLIVVENANRSVLLNRGIQAAKFSQVVFTEAHVEPEETFLVELNHWLASHTTIDAVYCRVVADYENHLAYWDAKCDDEGVAKHRDGNEWWNINIYAFSISKEKLLAAGAIDERYDLFSMLLLAAKCRDLGMTVAYAPAPAVLHHYRTTLSEVESQTRSFVRDEFRYRQDQPGHDRLGISVLPDRNALPDGALLGRQFLLAAMGRSVTRNWRVILDLVRTGASQLWNGAAIATWIDTPARRLAYARKRCHLFRWSRRRLESPYRDFRQSIAAAEHDELLRASVAVSHIATIPLATETLPSDWGSSVLGLHAQEIHQGTHFRWTHPVSYWRFGKNSGERRLVFRLLPARSDLRLSRIRAYWNGELLPYDHLEYATDSLVVSTPSTETTSDENLLVLVVSPMKMAKGAQCDRRRLGLPIILLKVEAARSAIRFDRKCRQAA
ncbi:MAG: glycosyltransferase [Planctomycetota bacterium]|nr:glycosyltransferase [Planctomycetota bacterium]